MGKEGTQLKQERLSFECNVTVGRELLALSQDVDGWEKRDCYSQLEDYLYRGERTRICLFMGSDVPVRQPCCGRQWQIWRRKTS